MKLTKNLPFGVFKIIENSTLRHKCVNYVIHARVHESSTRTRIIYYYYFFFKNTLHT